MARVTICAVGELPGEGQMREMAAESRTLCIANDGGRYAAVDNVCPHSGGPLAEGMIEDGKVLCPWHAWAFDLTTGRAEHEPGESVAVYPLYVEGGLVQVEL